MWFWVENPDGSWLWRQREWERLLHHGDIDLFRVDYCVYHAPWRKRTRFTNNLPELKGVTQLCRGGHKHVVLRGAAPGGGGMMTSLAEAYPHPIADILAAAIAHAAGLSLNRIDFEKSIERATARHAASSGSRGC